MWRGRAQYEKHEAKKDPEHAHRHKIEEEVAAAAAVGSGGFAFHEHHEKKKDHKEAEEAGGEKKHHFFGWLIPPRVLRVRVRVISSARRVVRAYVCMRSCDARISVAT